MNVIFLGPPGAGKGTIAKLFSDKHGIPHISTGDLFREAIGNKTELGLKVKSIIDEGGLVPDDITVALVRERFEQPDMNDGYILDGFPRTVPQAEGLEQFSELDAVVNFIVDEGLVIKRLSGRRIAKKSGRIYHILFNPPKVEGIDDETGEELLVRPDDREDAIRHRLTVYKKETEPLISYYDEKGILYSVNGSGTPAEVLDTVESALSSVR